MLIADVCIESDYFNFHKMFNIYFQAIKTKWKESVESSENERMEPEEQAFLCIHEW